MAWISDDRYLSQSEMENNANIIIAYYRRIGMDDRTIAGILGNMQAESTLSPGLNERGGGGGYGLVQWTPKSDLINACTTLGLSPYTSGDVQIKVIIQEIIGNSSVRQWYTSQGFIQNYYNSGATSDMIGITGTEFIYNTMGWTPDKLAVLFMAGYERPSYDPSINHYQNRKQYALNWYNYLSGNVSFIPRLTSDGMSGSKYWYSNSNPFYASNYGLPNCTCYAWGRFWEITEQNGYDNLPTLYTQDAETWYGHTQDGYERGNTPQLGAVICWENISTTGGHVAIVEQINNDGTIVTSNSAWGGSYFYTQTLNPNNNYYMGDNYRFQGFIYNPYIQTIPIVSNKKKKGYNFVLFNRRRRLKQYG